MLTAAVVRDAKIRAAFSAICWLNLSQLPDLIGLQGRLYQQLADNQKMPKAGAESVESGVVELRKVAAKRTVLIVCDDMWDSVHEKAFACIDDTTPSKILVTTRIKGILSHGTEVELKLLSVTESVELLASVAEIDSSQIPPVMLEIAQLCGRLPLCLGIVGFVLLHIYSFPSNM